MDIQKKIIQEELQILHKKFSKEYGTINPWGKKTVDLLFSFTSSGKLIRGSLLLKTYALFSKKSSIDKADDSPITAACALELIHSGLLIHDDIMDNDTLRRGQKTITRLLADTTNGTKHTGDSLAICVADFSFFAALNLCSQFNNTISSKITHEIALVGLGQMQDVYHINPPTIESILSVYTYKTARYTVSLPMALGAMLANADSETIQGLEKIGELMGVLFQIEDDLLGLYGKKEIIGKDPGSDIRENKLTLYRALLESEPKDNNFIEARKLFGNPNITSSQIADVIRLLEELGIIQKINSIKTELINQIHALIKTLNLHPEQEEFLNFLMNYLTKRQK